MPAAIQASDGTIIQVFNGGSMRFDSSTGAPPTALTSPRFIAPEGPHDWLNHALFVGTLRPDTTDRALVHIVIYQMG